MAELIDRQALMRNFCGYDLSECTKYGNKTAEQQSNSYSTMMMYEIADKIEDAPTVDAVKVVRCKDCKYRMLAGRAPFMYHRCAVGNGLASALKDDDYCSYGERREENAAD